MNLTKLLQLFRDFIYLLYWGFVYGLHSGLHFPDSSLNYTVQQEALLLQRDRARHL